MSIWLEDQLAVDDREPRSVVAGTPFLLVSIETGFVRTLTPEQQVERTPKEDEPAHGDVVGKKTDGVKNKLAASASWVVPPAA